jgi:hypothetical protein
MISEGGRCAVLRPDVPQGLAFAGHDQDWVCCCGAEEGAVSRRSGGHRASGRASRKQYKQCQHRQKLHSPLLPERVSVVRSVVAESTQLLRTIYMYQDF